MLMLRFAHIPDCPRFSRQSYIINQCWTWPFRPTVTGAFQATLYNSGFNFGSFKSHKNGTTTHGGYGKDEKYTPIERPGWNTNAPFFGVLARIVKMIEGVTLKDALNRA
ncbi:hypothetical protein OUZ56_010130 [Daphnia magna]|uniref:Uncharacterized protein n=1 Tax=Daphnia magna TaxID=35525 RepID=A0ABR0AHV9_9CRUS|nr:hypothetical protein OUZ56_010130 [Daphnia magna]